MYIQVYLNIYFSNTISSEYDFIFNVYLNIMKKYKNIFLTAIFIVAGMLAVMTNLHKSNKNVLKNSIKLNAYYNVKSTTNNKSANYQNIKNLNFTINDNSNNLNNIILNSEENIYGFKNTYKLASLPLKIIKIESRINNIKKEIKIENTKRNSEIKNINTSFVADEVISYSNYIKISKENLFHPLNFSNIVSKNNNSYKLSLKIDGRKIAPSIQAAFGMVAGGLTITAAGLTMYGAVRFCKILIKRAELYEKVISHIKTATW